jgi:DNA mismatch repair protein MutS
MGILDQYELYYNKYRAVYGDRIAVLFQVGTFHQLYGIDNDTEQSCNLSELANLLNIKETRVNTSILENSRANPQLAGFNSVALDSNVDRLVGFGYTVIVINQTGSVNKDGEMTRDVAYIQSPSTTIDMNAVRDPYLVSIYLKQEINKSMARSYDYIGMAAMDITTGQSFFYETSASPCDPDLAMDNLKRFLQTFSPVEAIVNAEDGYNLQTETVESWGFRLCNEHEHGHGGQHLNLKPTAYVSTNVEETSIAYQEKILTDLLNIPDPLVSLNITSLPMATKALIHLLKFCADHNTALLKAIGKPKPWGTGSHLVLDTRSIIQLGILESYYDQLRTDSVVNHLSKWTVTSVGRRTLRHRLLNCITCPLTLQARYDEVSRMYEILTVKPETVPIIHNLTFQDLPLHEVVYRGLKGIKDLDRMHRKLALGTLSPAEFYTLDINYRQLCTLFTLDPHPEELTLLTDFMKLYESVLDMQECGRCTVTEHIRNSIFVKGYNTDIDSISDEIVKCEQIRQEAIKLMSDLVAKGSGCCKYKDGGLTAVAGTGCWVTLTKPQFTKFDSAFPKEGLKVQSQDLKIKPIIITRDSLSVDTRNKSNIKIEVTLLDDLLRNQDNATGRLRSLSIAEYDRLLGKLKEYIPILDKIANCTGIMDLNQAIARVSLKYGYCKPEIASASVNESFLNVQQLRHPLVERRCTYIPHDIDLGSKEGGMLLYGVNQSGKSCTMKSVGIAVVMAQAGFFVPAKSFSYYPYKNLMTRIIGNDNIDNGLSSYAVEMMELRSILTRACNHTLVLGDEVCHGTESASAVSLVAASLMHLDKTRSSFIFATHLHELSQMEEVAHIRQFHITVQFAPDGRIIYDRQFKPGSGKGLYGIEVARHLRLPGDVIHDAVKIRNKYFPNSAVPPEPTVSKYNTSCFISKCEIRECRNKAVHTHHIRYQSEAINGLVDGYLDINHKDNLIGLCEQHHDEVHHGNKEGMQLIIFNRERYEYRRILRSLDRKIEIPTNLKA